MNYKIIQVLRRGAWVKAFRRNASDSRTLHLGQRVEFFLADDFCIPEQQHGSEMFLYAGELGEVQEEFAGKLMKFLENADEVLGAEARLRMAAEDNCICSE